ncbi:MAG TPA: hypothetical protein VMD29_00820 [Terracidiphilus sp.]|nr:hypothetical protein [Terracidiphilus sp.]
MEIGPISGIRPVMPGKPAARHADLTGVFAVELREQAREEDDAAGRRAARGLEDEDAEDGAASDEETGDSGGRPSVNFFA